MKNEILAADTVFEQDVASPQEGHAVIRAVRSCFQQRRPTTLPRSSNVEAFEAYFQRGEEIVGQRVDELHQRFYFPRSQGGIETAYRNNFGRALRSLGSGVLLLAGVEGWNRPRITSDQLRHPLFLPFTDERRLNKFLEEYALDFEQIALMMSDTDRRIVLPTGFSSSRPYIHSPAEIAQFLEQYGGRTSLNIVRKSLSKNPYDKDKGLRQRLAYLTDVPTAIDPAVTAEAVVDFLRSSPEHGTNMSHGAIRLELVAQINMFVDTGIALLQDKLAQDRDIEPEGSEKIQNRALSHFATVLRSVFRDCIRRGDEGIIKAVTEGSTNEVLLGQLADEFILIAKALATKRQGNIYYGWDAALPQVHSADDVKSLVKRHRKLGVSHIKHRISANRSIENINERLLQDRQAVQRLKKQFPWATEAIIIQALSRAEDPESLLAKTQETFQRVSSEPLFMEHEPAGTLRVLFYQPSEHSYRSALRRKALKTELNRRFLRKQKTFSNSRFDLVLRLADQFDISETREYISAPLLLDVSNYGEHAAHMLQKVISAADRVKHTKRYSWLERSVIAFIISRNSKDNVWLALDKVLERSWELYTTHENAKSLTIAQLQLIVAKSPDSPNSALLKKMARRASQQLRVPL